jgi:hypothetical protein
MVLALAPLTGCFHKDVTIRAVEPATKEIVGISRLAVIDLSYAPKPEVGRNLANTIVAELGQSGGFEVMERSAVAKVLDEQKFGTSGMVDTATITSIGKLLGVDGVIVGEVLAFDVGNKALGKDATVGLNIRLVSIHSAKVIFSDSITVNYSKFMGGDRKESILGQLSEQVAKEFVGKIAPHYVMRKKVLLPAGGEAGKTCRRGITFASNGLWDKAQEQWEEALRIAPEAAAPHNNLAVCYEHFGKLQKAVEEYEKAIRLDPDQEAIHRNLASIRDTFRPPVETAKQALENQKQVTSQPASRSGQ